MTPYQEQFPTGTPVRVASRDALEGFMRDWRWHHPLESERLQFAGSETTVESVGFYHGGDVLYTLRGIPGIWHEACLVSANQPLHRTWSASSFS